MEIPKPMKSTVTPAGDSLLISTPKTTSWILVFIFGVLLLQNVNGFIRGLFFDHQLPWGGKLFVAIFCPSVVLLTLKGLLWQLKGVKTLEVSSEKIVFRKIAPLRSRKKEYDVKAIKSISVKNDTATIGPLAMIQLLKITDRVNIVFSYGYTTITTIGGFNSTEAAEIVQLIKDKTGIQ